MDINTQALGNALRKEFAMEWGHHAVTIWTVVTLEDYRTKQESKYGPYEDYEVESHEYALSQGATHVARCVLGGFGLVDGADVPLSMDGDTVTFHNEPGQDFNGGELEEAYMWVRDLGVPVESIVTDASE